MLEPFGQIRGDLQAGVVAATVANCSRDPKTRPEPFSASDFLLRFEASEPAMSPEVQAAYELQRFQMFAMEHNARLNREAAKREAGAS